MSNTPLSGSERIIDQVLAEAGLEDADDLRPVLLELRSFGTEQPEPSAEILALMAGGSSVVASAGQTSADLNSADHKTAETHDAGSTVVVDLAARRRNKRRLPLTAFGVAAALAVGGGAAAAADQGIRDSLNEAFSTIAATFGRVGHQESPNNQTVPGPSETDGQLQGTPASPAVSTPGTSGSTGSPNDGAPGQDGRSPGPGNQPGPGSGRPFVDPWLNKTPPAIPNVPGAPAVPAPALTPPALGLPSVPALPTPERTAGGTP